MNASLENTMSQMKASPAKSAILGVLVLVLLVLVVRVALSVSPKSASALPIKAADSVRMNAVAVPDAASQELERAAAQSSALWKTLRSRRGIPPQSAFRFDPGYYMSDPGRISRSETSGKQVVTKSESKSADANSTRTDLTAVVPLLLQSTATGARPTAVINMQILQIGDSIQGYTVAAIRAREVVVKKDGQSYTLEMGR